VLNADDPLVAAMAEQVKGKVAYFSMDPNNEILQNHLRRDGMAAVYENGYISILEGQFTLRIEEAVNVPMTMKGMAPFMIANALAACLAAFCQGVDIEDIRQGVRTFKASANQTPGRMNLFNLGDYHALVDYAHNPAGYEAVGEFVKNWKGQRLGVVGGPGDRRDEDLVLLGKIAAKVFDRILVKEDDDKRGRPRGEAADLIIDGILSENEKADYQAILDETEAIEYGLDKVDKDGLVVIFPESVTRAISLINKRNPI
uniref:glutamate ligase domain-containing protein n=1 Tax=Cyanothece sp. BG0011 TaxID=2082950 RepID=UPI00271466A4